MKDQPIPTNTEVELGGDTPQPRTATVTAVPERVRIYNVFERLYAYQYYEEHRAEINSTSPYAVTDKLPELRVVDNAITKGSWSVDALSSTDHYGFFGGYKGSSTSGGGGGGSVDTTVQFDHVNMCPVTHREFTDEELKKYHEKWLDDVRNYARHEAEHIRWWEDFDTNKLKVAWHGGIASFGYEELENLYKVYTGGKELEEIVAKATEKTK